MKYMAAIVFIVLGLAGNSAYAACTAPAGSEGQLRYDTGTKKPYFCDGANWQEMGGASLSAIVTYVDSGNVNVCAPPSVTNCGSAIATCPAGHTVIGGTCEFTNHAAAFNNGPGIAFTSSTVTGSWCVTNTCRQAKCVAVCAQ